MKNVLEFEKHKQESQPISMITCYDAWSARIIAKTGIDCVLVGDSVAMVCHGFESTLAADVPMMAFHVAAVARGLCSKKFLVGDMPFMSFRKGEKVAMESAEALMKAGAQAVKLEGIRGHESVVQGLVESGIPVMGHLGLTPQSVNAFGGFKVQARQEDAARQLIQDAKTLQELGCFSLVLECVPAALAKSVSEVLKIPTIGIGAGVDCDGQVLVMQDLLGMNSEFKTKFLKHYANGEEFFSRAFDEFHREVRERRFPTEEHSY